MGYPVSMHVTVYAVYVKPQTGREGWFRSGTDREYITTGEAPAAIFWTRDDCEAECNWLNSRYQGYRCEARSYDLGQWWRNLNPKVQVIGKQDNLIRGIQRHTPWLGGHELDCIRHHVLPLQGVDY